MTLNTSPEINSLLVGIQELHDELVLRRRNLAQDLLGDLPWRKKGNVWKINTQGGDRYSLYVDRDLLYVNSFPVKVPSAIGWLYEAKTETPTLENAWPAEDKPPKGARRVFKEEGYTYRELASKRQRDDYNRLPPPRATLQNIVGYDPILDRLYYVENGRPVFYPMGEEFPEVDGLRYAAWRLKSELVFGNPHGLGGQEIDALYSMPKGPASVAPINFVDLIEQHMLHQKGCDVRLIRSCVARIVGELFPGVRRKSPDIAAVSAVCGGTGKPRHRRGRFPKLKPENENV